MDPSKKTFRGNKLGAQGNKRGFRNLGFIILIGLFGLVIFAAYNQPSTLKEIPITQAITEANQGKYQKIQVDANELLITKKGEDAPALKSYKEVNVGLKEQGLQPGKVEVFNKPAPTGNGLGDILLALLPVIIICAVLFLMLRSAQGQGNQALSFGKSRARLYSAVSNC